MNFAPHLRTIFSTRGRAATYTPLVGAAVACKAVRQGGGTPIQVGPVRVTPERTFFHVLRADIAAPVAGASLETDAETFTVEAVQPAERDPDRLLWALEVEWGAEIVYRSVTGVGASQNPPQGTGFTVAAAANAGDGTISIKAGFAVGKLLAGDSFTIAGDATVYSVTGAGMQAASNQFTAVPITPVLAADAALGAAVTFDFARDYAMRAAIAGYQASEIMGGILIGDRRLVIFQAELEDAGLTGEPKAGDKVTLGSRQLTVIAATAIYQGAEAYGWDIQVRG